MPAKFSYTLSAMNPFRVQQAIKENAQDMQDFVSDLSSWEDDIRKKEEKLLSTRGVTKTTYAATNPADTSIQADTSLTPRKNQILSPADIVVPSVESNNTESAPQSASEMALEQKQKGNKAFSFQKYALAISCYTKCIEFDPENATVGFANRAMAYLKLKRFEEAEEDCTSCIQLTPNYIKAWQRRGVAKMQMKKINEAIADFKHSLTIDATNQESLRYIQALEKHIAKQQANNRPPTAEKPSEIQTPIGSKRAPTEAPIIKTYSTELLDKKPVVKAVEQPLKTQLSPKKKPMIVELS